MSDRETPGACDETPQPSVPVPKPWNAPRVEEIDLAETETWPLKSRFLDGDVLADAC